MTTAMQDASRISTKYQAVIPKTVRERLGLSRGDLVRFRVTAEGNVMLEKVRTMDDPFASFGEWSSEEDERLYREL